MIRQRESSCWNPYLLRDTLKIMAWIKDKDSLKCSQAATHSLLAHQETCGTLEVALWRWQSGCGSLEVALWRWQSVGPVGQGKKIEYSQSRDAFLIKFRYLYSRVQYCG
jgi:hypothetical protein